MAITLMSSASKSLLGMGGGLEDTSLSESEKNLVPRGKTKHSVNSNFKKLRFQLNKFLLWLRSLIQRSGKSFLIDITIQAGIRIQSKKLQDYKY